MNRAIILGLAGLLCAGFVRAADEPLPSPEALMDKYIDATGGKAAYEKRRNEITIGTMEFTGKGIKGTVTAYSDVSNNNYTVIEIEGVGKIEQGVYNGTAWESSAIQGSRIKQGAERDEFLRDATFNSEIHWRELYPKSETVGAEEVGGSPAYKVVLTPADGKPQTEYFDKKSGLMVKRTATVVNPMGEIPMEMTFTDYKNFGGILRPAKVSQKAMGQEFSITLDDTKTNVEIPKDRFEPPAAVKKLMEKPASPSNGQ